MRVRLMVVVGVVMALWAGPPTPRVSASTVEEPSASSADTIEVLPANIGVPVPGRMGGLYGGDYDQVNKHGRPLVAWPQRRQVFMFLNQGVSTGSWLIRSVDVDTREVQAESRIPLNGPYPMKVGLEQNTVALDHDRGRLFVPFSDWTRTVPEANAVNGTGVRDGTPQTCVSDGKNCMHGFYVFNAETLEVQKLIRFPSISLGSAPPTSITPRAVSYAPVDDRPGAGKLHVLVQESSLPELTTIAGPAGMWRTSTSTHLWYVMQVDVDRGVLDWTVRVDGCRTTRDRYVAVMHRPHSGALFRTRSADPETALVAVCAVGGAQGVAISRIPLSEAVPPSDIPVGLDTGGTTSAVSGETPEPQGTVRQSPGQRAFFGPEKTVEYIADPEGGRVLLRVIDQNEEVEVWWVFDTLNWRLLGTIGIGKVSMQFSWPALDPATGRLYSFTDRGLFIADARRTPLPQALAFPELGYLALPRGTNASDNTPLPVVLSASDRHPHPMVVVAYPGKDDGAKTLGGLRLVEDRVPISGDAPGQGDYAGRTLDLDEVDGVTQAVLDGTARGYGLRMLLVGGVDAATRVGPLDAPGAVWQMGEPGPIDTRPMYNTLGNPRSPCTAAGREVVLGFAGPQGPAVVDAGGSRGAAEPVVVDSGGRADAENPMRCVSHNAAPSWEALWGKALFGNPPVAEPTTEWPFDGEAKCVTGSDPVGAVGDPVTGVFAARAECAEGEASGFAYARGAKVAGVEVGEALSSFRIYRDPARGIVSTVHSVTRGVHIPGVLRVDTVRGVAESWANGRKFTPPESDANAVYDPHCDFERTAGTCYRRSVFGVWTPGYSCGPCGPAGGEATLADRMTRGMGANGSVRFRSPDPNLARGADNGFLAAVTKPDAERFSDLVLNNDLLQTVVPTMEVIRQAPPNRFLTGGGPAGRQVLQFAGVEVSSSYGIECLLVYDEATNTCSGEVRQPASLTVLLQDADGKALPGGAFELREDSDADGVAGLADKLLPEGACVTAVDGTGTCTWPSLPPGDYVLTQTAAPAGYAAHPEPFAVTLESGEQRTVTFSNVANTSTVVVTATDENGKPLSGATFAIYPDPDADGKVAADAQPAAKCDTGADGVCSMTVPTGSYALVQSRAPNGLEPIEPVAFALTTGGQTAAVTVTNYPVDTAGSVAAPPPAAAPLVTIDTPPPLDVETAVETAQPVMSEAEPATAPAPSLPDAIGGTVVRVIAAPGDALQLLARTPKQAVAYTAALLLFALAATTVTRRRRLYTLTHDG